MQARLNLTPNQAEFTRAAGGLSPTESSSPGWTSMASSSCEPSTAPLCSTGRGHGNSRQSPLLKPEATGAGDSFIAMLAVACASEWEETMRWPRLANHAGRLACLASAHGGGVTQGRSGRRT